MLAPWYTFPIVVPFGDPNFDSALGGAHDIDIGAPANYPVTALLPGKVSSITAPKWGKQVGILLDTPYNGVPYCAFLHLSAVSPALLLGHHVNTDDLIGWVGGANSQSQYTGTSNPTGQNFLNDSFNSSRIQVGFALMRGPEYGTAGWENFPPVDWKLDPSQIILNARKVAQPAIVPDHFVEEAAAAWGAFYKTLRDFITAINLPLPANFQAIPPMGTGIYKAWVDAWRNHGKQMGPAIGFEYPSVTQDGTPIIVQEFAHARCEDGAGKHAWIGPNGVILVN